MDKHRVEAQVGAFVDAVIDGHDIEHDYVECKGIWPQNHYKAARQIAALCNAAGGLDAMWIVGLDEGRRQVLPLADTELANWWPQTKRFFSELPPELGVLRVPTRHGMVVALVFATDRSPYVITVPDDTPVNREVPFREGNRTDSATRAQLHRLLIERTLVPDLEFIDPVVTSDHVVDPIYESSPLNFRTELFISAARPVMLPEHQWSLEIQAEEWEALNLAPLRPPVSVIGTGARVAVDNAGVHLSGTARLFVSAVLTSAAGDPERVSQREVVDTGWTVEHLRSIRDQPSLRVKLVMPVDRHSRAASASIELVHRLAESGGSHSTWRPRDR